MGVDLNVSVLTSGYWPTQIATSCSIPPEIGRCCDEFKKYYLGKHSGRRLTWQTNMVSIFIILYYYYSSLIILELLFSANLFVYYYIIFLLWYYYSFVRVLQK